MKTKTFILILTITLTVGVIVWVYQEAKKRRATLPQQLNPQPAAPPTFASFGGGSGGGGSPTNGFIITGVGQVVTGASPQQSWHTVAAPARVINLSATPVGSYSGTVTINGHTEPLTNLNVSPSGYPAVYFNPTNPVWGITSAGNYTVSITLNIGGTNYTQSVITEVTNTDLGLNSQTGNGFVITGIGQVVTGASPQQSWHTVAAPARVINLQATPSGTYSGSVTINGHTENLANLNISANGYPAVFFDPINPVWNISSAGTYTISITFNIGGTNYTRTTTTIVTNTDLGISGGETSNPVASSVQTDLINIVKNNQTGLYSDTAPDNISGYLAYYYVNGYPYLNLDGSRKKFENESFSAGLNIEVGKVFLDPNQYPTYQSWLENGWQTKIKVGNDYPNDGWIMAYAQQEIVTA